jgi:hypothetical protein
VALLSTVLVAGALGGCDLETAKAARGGASSADTSSGTDHFRPTHGDEAAIRSLMRDRQVAVLHHDRQAFQETVDPGQPKLLEAQMTLYDNLQKLPLATISYDVSTTYLSPAEVPGHDPVLHPEMVENVRLRGTNDHAIANNLDVTVVRRGGHWLVGAERPPGTLTYVKGPQERPWFGVPIAVHHDDTLTVVVDQSDADELDGLVGAVRAGLARDAGYLDVPVKDQVLVDATSNGAETPVSTGGNGEVEAVTIPLYSTGSAEKADGSLAGVAIKVNPRHVQELIDDDRVLWHELTHYLLFDRMAGSPVWLIEGVAAWDEWQPLEMDELVVPDDVFEKAQRPPHELPTGRTFYGRADADYPIAQAAVQWLVQRAGIDKLLELMKAYGRFHHGADADTVTPRALREVYGISEEELVAGTYATLSTLQH